MFHTFFEAESTSEYCLHVSFTSAYVCNKIYLYYYSLLFRAVRMCALCIISFIWDEPEKKYREVAMESKFIIS